MPPDQRPHASRTANRGHSPRQPDRSIGHDSNHGRLRQRPQHPPTQATPPPRGHPRAPRADRLRSHPRQPRDQRRRNHTADHLLRRRHPRRRLPLPPDRATDRDPRNDRQPPPRDLCKLCREHNHLLHQHVLDRGATLGFEVGRIPDTPHCIVQHGHPCSGRGSKPGSGRGRHPSPCLVGGSVRPLADRVARRRRRLRGALPGVAPELSSAVPHLVDRSAGVPLGWTLPVPAELAVRIVQGILALTIGMLLDTLDGRPAGGTIGRWNEGRACDQAD